MFHVPAHKNTAHPAGQIRFARTEQPFAPAAADLAPIKHVWPHKTPSLEGPDFCRTGSVYHSDIQCGLRIQDDFFFHQQADYALCSPDYIPTGSLRNVTILVSASVPRY